MLENYYLRRPTEKDIKAVLALMLRCDERDVGFPDSDLTELQNDWDEIDLSQDAWLAIDKKKSLQGYCGVFPWNSGWRFDAYDAPGAEESDLFLSLMVLAEGRARFLINKGNDPEKQTITTHISASVTHQNRIIKEAGYSVSKHIFNLHRDLEGDFPPPKWPNGIALRSMKPGKDDHALYTLIETAFTKPGRPRVSFEEWKKFMMSRALFSPEIWFILEKKGEMIGCALCFNYDEIGWVRQLAVREDQRGQGFGRMLLEHSFHVFKENGMPKVGLATESVNEKALKLYTSAGMRKTVHLHEYSKAAVKHESRGL